MPNKRTGLLIEAAELQNISSKSEKTNIFTKQYPACNVTTVVIKNDEESELLGRDKGTYITVEFDKIYNINDRDFDNVTDVIARYLRSFTDKYMGKRIVVAGIGNRSITADSIGPKAIDRIIVTRGLENTEFIGEDCFGNVCAICADVFGVTGIESAEVIEGIAKVLKPELVIVIDALATVSISRLCKTVQISDTTLIPGGGVDNARKGISPDIIDVPIVSIGIPTVIDAATFVQDVKCLGEYSDCLVSMPARIDDATNNGAKLIAFALNKALHNGLSTDDILKFLY